MLYLFYLSILSCSYNYYIIELNKFLETFEFLFDSILIYLKLLRLYEEYDYIIHYYSIKSSIDKLIINHRNNDLDF